MKNLFAAYKTIHSLHIRSSAVLVYYFLCAQTNKENECWPSKNTIAKSCHVSVSTVTRALRELEDVGMLVTVYRFRKESNRQTSNIYKVYDTPQTFTKPPENTKPEQGEQIQDKPEVNPIQNEAAACTVSNTEDPCIQSTIESPVDTQNAHSSNIHSSVQNVESGFVRAQERNPRGHSSVGHAFSLLGAVFTSTLFQNDMLSRVTVTPQGTISKKRVTDNLRVRSIFSKLTKWKEKRTIFGAGFQSCPARNE